MSAFVRITDSNRAWPHVSEWGQQQTFIRAGLEMSKAHLNVLAFISRFEQGLCLHQPSRHIAGIFLNITGCLSGRIFEQHCARWHAALCCLEKCGRCTFFLAKVTE
jgi:hypothetical protein